MGLRVSSPEKLKTEIYAIWHILAVYLVFGTYKIMLNRVILLLLMYLFSKRHLANIFAEPIKDLFSVVLMLSRHFQNKYNLLHSSKIRS